MEQLELTALGPEWPPVEVWLEVDRAAGAWEELRERGHEIDFAVPGENGRIRISLRDLSGNVVRPLSPAEAIAVASGA